MPHSRIGRFLLALWLTACIALLAFAFVQRSVHDMPEGAILLMIFLTFPIGLIGAPVAGIVGSSITDALAYAHGPFIDLLPVWCVLVALGYLQWFVFLPSAFRWLRAYQIERQSTR